MAVFYCETCDRHIDLDYDVDHEEECAFENGTIAGLVKARVDGEIHAAVLAERERAAKVAEAHIGSTEKRRHELQIEIDPEGMAEVYSEERGEDITAEMIAAAIRKEPDAD